jgi:hypothetical protein
MHRFLLALLLITLGWFASPASLFATPRVSIDETSYDFGVVSQGQLVTANFSIKNSGMEPLVIEKIEFSMSGMNVKVKQRIEPEEEIQARITWDTSRLRREITGLATLYFNDSSMPQIILSLSGVVTPAIELLPRPAYYLSQYTGERHSQIITLKNNQDHPLEIASLSTTSNNFEYHFKETESGKVFELTVLAKADAPIGRFHDSLIVNTTDPKHPRLHLEVNILVKPDVYLSQEKLEFGRISLSQISAKPGFLDFIKQSLVIGRREGEMTIKAISSDLSFLEFAAEPKNEAQSFILEVGLLPDKLELGNFSGTISIVTSDTKFPELRLPVSAIIVNH